jgi:hypothetical protein
LTTETARLAVRPLLTSELFLILTNQCLTLIKEFNCRLLRLEILPFEDTVIHLIMALFRFLVGFLFTDLLLNLKWISQDQCPCRVRSLRML